MFGLAPHPQLERPQRGSPRMFRIDWIEKYFSRVKWWHVLAIWVPFAAWCVALQARDPQSSPLGIAGLFAAGMFTWTLLEYTLHRLLFHFVPDPRSEFQTDMMWLIHGIHHDYPWDGDRLVMPPFATAVVAAALWFPSRWLLGAHAHYAFFGGLVFGYVCYDLTHYWLHHSAPASAAGKWLRRYHLVHHFSTPGLRFGITTPLWDLVFRTFPDDRWVAAREDKVAELEQHAHG